MIIFNRRFAPDWRMSLISFGGILLFVSLGVWQLDRAAYKQSVKQKFEARLASDFRRYETPQSFMDIEFEKVIMRGRYDLRRTLLIDNQLYRGQVGYQLLSPFLLDGGSRVLLVNRGWLALGDTRDQLPRLEAPPVDGSIRGIVSIPNTAGYRLGKVDLKDSWPQVIPYVDIEAMQAEFENRLLPIVLWLDPDQAGHYRRDWKPVWANPDKSRAYAWQWFAFAAIAFGLFVGLNLKKLNHGK